MKAIRSKAFSSTSESCQKWTSSKPLFKPRLHLYLGSSICDRIDENAS